MSEDWSDMNDENQTQDAPSGEQGEPQVQEPEPSPYLKRSAMLPVEGIVYCLEHTLVHDDTENPYGEGPESWCKKDEHRPVYYRARKGDLDERAETEPNGAPRPRIAAAASSDRLTTAESGLVVRLTRTLHTNLTEINQTLSRILGEDSTGDRRSDPLLALTNSILAKLDGAGDGAVDREDRDG
jgi:hypothetical protein